MNKSVLTKVFFKAARAAAAILALTAFFSCKEAKEKNFLEKIKSKGELVIATEGTWAPWNFHDKDGELTGYDIDIGKEICKRLGVKPRFIEVAWDRIFDSLESGECDIILNGVGVNSEREGRYYFTEPYAYSKTVLLVHSNNDDIKSFSDLRGRTSANALGSNYCNIADKYGAIIILIDTFDETMDLLLQNRADTTINSDLSYYDYMNKYPNAKIKIAAVSDEISSIAIPCKRKVENLPLLAELNKALKEMRSAGILEELSIEYFKKDITK